MSETPKRGEEPESYPGRPGVASPGAPALRTPPPPDEPLASPAGDSGPGDARLPGLDRDRLLRVLVVEDSRLNAMVLTHLLVRCSCVLHCAADGRQALDYLRRNAYDLVLMDIEMPVMDGIAATLAIRSGEVGPQARDIPIVAITAHTTEPDRVRCLEAGMDGFVPRPFAPDTLAAAIRQALDRSGN